MKETTGLVVYYTKCTTPALEGEWEEWYDNEHLPALLAAEGAPWVVTRWVLTAKPTPGMPSVGFSHLTIFELDDEPSVQAEQLLARAAALRVAGEVPGHHGVVDAQVFAAHGLFTDKPEPSDALQGHVLAHVFCTDPEREAEWDAWYDREHVPDMMDSGAFAAATRWVRIPSPTHGPAHITLYDVTGHSVETVVQLSAAVMPGLVAAGRKPMFHTGGLTVTLEPAGRYGGEVSAEGPSSL